MDTYDYIYITLISSYIFLRKRKQNKKKRLWVRPIYVRRPLFGDFQHLFQELKEDAIMFFKYTRMNLVTFNKLLDILRSHLEKRNWRALPAEQRLIIMLRYLYMLLILIANLYCNNNNFPFLQISCDRRSNIINRICTSNR